MIPAEARVTEMFHAMYSHRGIITEKRQSEFRLLLVPGKVPLASAMDAITAIEDERITGEILIRPERAISAWAVLKSAAGMIAGYICRTIREILEAIQETGLSGLEAKEHGVTRRLTAALGVIEPLMRLDRRWVLLPQDHVDDLLQNVTKLYAVIPEGDRGSFPLLDLDELAAWRNEVVEG